MMSKRIVAAGVIALMALTFGCGQQQPAPTGQQQQGQTYGTNVPNAQQQQALEQQIRKTVEELPGMKTQPGSWQVKATNGKVTLTGTVASEQEHQQILSAAKGIAGEQNVVDELKVAPAAAGNGAAQPKEQQSQQPIPSGK